MATKHLSGAPLATVARHSPVLVAFRASIRAAGVVGAAVGLIITPSSCGSPAPSAPTEAKEPDRCEKISNPIARKVQALRDEWFDHVPGALISFKLKDAKAVQTFAHVSGIAASSLRQGTLVRLLICNGTFGGRMPTVDLGNPLIVEGRKTGFSFDRKHNNLSDYTAGHSIGRSFPIWGLAASSEGSGRVTFYSSQSRAFVQLDETLLHEDKDGIVFQEAGAEPLLRALIIFDDFYAELHVDQTDSAGRDLLLLEQVATTLEPGLSTLGQGEPASRLSGRKPAAH